MRAELQLQKIKLAFKAMQNIENHPILYDTLIHALIVGTPWTDGVNELIGDTLGPGKWLRNHSDKEELLFAEIWLANNKRISLARLERKVTTTTGLFRELVLPGSRLDIASYITTNPRLSNEIR